MLEMCPTEVKITRKTETFTYVQGIMIQKDNSMVFCLVCNLCGKRFTREKQLRRHQRNIHTERKPVQCTICSLELRDKMALSRHMPVHTSETPQCEVCQKTFLHKSSLVRHIGRVHLGEKPYECEMCDRKFGCSTYLDTHRRIHLNEKPFECLICKKTFYSKSNLTSHGRMHSGEKPFDCEVCEKSFSDLSVLKRHMRIHTGDKPYGCEVCGKSFSQTGSLKRHLRTHKRGTPVEDVYNPDVEDVYNPDVEDVHNPDVPE